jgi:spore coat protein CotF
MESYRKGIHVTKEKADETYLDIYTNIQQDATTVSCFITRTPHVSAILSAHQQQYINPLTPNDL